MKKFFGHAKGLPGQRMPYEDNSCDWDEDREEYYQEDTQEYEEDGQYAGESEYIEEYEEDGQYAGEAEYVEEYEEDGQYAGEAEYVEEYEGDGQYAGEAEYVEEYEGDGQYAGEAEYVEEYEEDGQYAGEAEYVEEYEGDGQYADEAEYIEEYEGDGQYAGEIGYGGEYEEPEYTGDSAEYLGETEYAEETGEYYEKPQKSKKSGKAASSGKKSGKRILSGMDLAIIVTGAAIVVMALFIGGIYLKSRMGETKASDFVSVGSQLDGITTIGGKGLVAVADAELAKMAAANAVLEEQRRQEEKDNSQANDYEENDYDKSAVIAMSLTSVQKDLKIKISNKDTGKLVANVPFSVEVTRPDKSKETWSDDDMDGIIYKKNIEPGSYTVAMKELSDEKYSKYLIGTRGQAVEVQKDISYEKVDVSNEIKKESEVDVAKEDTEKKETTVESVLPDTVEWVASTVSPGAYTEVSKSDIPLPELATTSKAFLRTAANISMESLDMKVGDSYRLEASYTDDDTDEEIPYAALAWSSENTNVATVDREGWVKAVGYGTTMISYYGVVLVEGEDEDWEEVECNGYCMVFVTQGGAGAGTGSANSGTGSSTGVVTVEQNLLTMSVGGITETKAAASGFDAGRELSFSVSSDNSAVATAQIDKSGKIEIKAVGAGETKLNVRVNYTGGDRTTEAGASITIKVEGDTAFSLSRTTLTLRVSETASLDAVIGNGISPGGTVTAESSDTAVAAAAVDGLRINVTAGKTGSAVITVKYTEGGREMSAACTVTVSDDPGQDNSTKLLDRNNNQVYVLENGEYREAVLADYFTADRFFVMSGMKYTGWQTIDGRVYYYNVNGEKVTGEQVIQGLKYNFADDGALVTDAGVMGIDVSKWNGTIDWQAVKNSGISYVIIRCGYRGSSQGSLIEDSMFTANIKGANEAGLKVGVYFFTQAIDEVEAVYEASYVLEKIKNYKISYPVFLDVEPSGGRGDQLDKSARTAVCRAFCETIRSAGYTAGIYANKTWLTEKMDVGQLSSYKIWLAQYAAAPSYGGKYDMWQYKSTGRVSGISGDVDLNISYMNQ